MTAVERIRRSAPRAAGPAAVAPPTALGLEAAGAPATARRALCPDAGAATGLRRLPAQRALRSGRLLLGPLAMAVAVIAIWWVAVAATGTSVIVAPSPLDVWRELRAEPGTYASAAWSTIRTGGLGLLIGVSGGTLLAVAKWWSSLLAGLTELPALFMRSVPFVAIVPVLSSVLGYGGNTTLVCSCIISFFPSFALVDSGMRTAPPGADDLFRVIGSAKTSRLLRLALPAALPQAATALRISATLCILGTMSSEYLTGSGGLGALYAASRISYLHPARGWSVAVITAVLSFVAFGAASAVERRARARFAPL